MIDGSYVNRREFGLSTPSRYKKLVLVGHSGGGLVIRQAIYSLTTQLQAEKLDIAAISASMEPNLLKAKLRLFAPALLGVKFSGLLATVVHSNFLGNVGSWGLLWSAAYADMSSNNKINELRTGTETFGDRWKNLSGFRAIVLWGKKDHIVTPGKYRVDVTSPRAEGKNHSSVCKPTAEYSRPLELVSES